MSLYNRLNGVNMSSLLILPMLNIPVSDIPRFRDCFVAEGGEHIELFTRVGGGNRGCGYGEEVLTNHPNFEYTFDDDFDCTYGSYVFNVPHEHKEDFEYIKKGEFESVSKVYVEKIKQYHNSEKIRGLIDKVFKAGEENAKN